jgi:hypothetical protein
MRKLLRRRRIRSNVSGFRSNASTCRRYGATFKRTVVAAVGIVKCLRSRFCTLPSSVTGESSLGSQNENPAPRGILDAGQSLACGNKPPCGAPQICAYCGARSIDLKVEDRKVEGQRTGRRADPRAGHGSLRCPGMCFVGVACTPRCLLQFDLVYSPAIFASFTLKRARGCQTATRASGSLGVAADPSESGVASRLSRSRRT